jgi:hypothetical protein
LEGVWQNAVAEMSLLTLKHNKCFCREFCGVQQKSMNAGSGLDSATVKGGISAGFQVKNPGESD